jgi:hypothetical protein
MAVSFRAVGTWENGSTGLTADEVVSIPAGTTTGDMMLLLASWKDFAITATVAGWTELVEFADGSVATGNGTGSMKVGCWYKEHDGSEANPTLDFSSTTGLVGEAVIISFQKGASDTWDTPLAVTGGFSIATSTPSVAGSTDVDVPDGSAIVTLMGVRDDSATFTRAATTGISATGGVLTFTGDYQEAPATHASTTTGNDMSCDAGYRLVTTGAATVELNTFATLSASETGTVLWVVLGVTAALDTRVPYYRPMTQLLAH